MKHRHEQRVCLEHPSPNSEHRTFTRFSVEEVTLRDRCEGEQIRYRDSSIVSRPTAEPVQIDEGVIREQRLAVGRFYTAHPVTLGVAEARDAGSGTRFRKLPLTTPGGAGVG